MSLKQNIADATKSAMKEKDKEKTTVLRGLSAAFKQVEIDEQITLGEAQALAVLEKQIKQRKDAFQQFDDAGRSDLADKENREIIILSAFLPKQLTESEISELIVEAIKETGASSMSAMRDVITYVKPSVQGKADMSLVSKLIKDKLS